MHPSRPVFLTLWQIALPLPGVVSILHRVSGVLMVLAVPLAALLLERALAGPDGFAWATALLASWPARLLVLVLLWALLHHLLAGVRHLALDVGFGLELAAARRSARWVLGATPLLVVLALLLGWLR